MLLNDEFEKAFGSGATFKHYSLERYEDYAEGELYIQIQKGYVDMDDTRDWLESLDSKILCDELPHIILTDHYQYRKGGYCKLHVVFQMFADEQTANNKALEVAQQGRM